MITEEGFNRGFLELGRPKSIAGIDPGRLGGATEKGNVEFAQSLTSRPARCTKRRRKILTPSVNQFLIACLIGSAAYPQGFEIRLRGIRRRIRPPSFQSSTRVELTGSIRVTQLACRRNS